MQIMKRAAQRAFDSMAASGGIRLAVDVVPHQQFAEWGLHRIERAEEI